MLNKLPDAELLVMSIIWDAKVPIPTTDIARTVNERYQKKWTASTIQSLLNRLSARRFVTSERNGKLKYYTAAIPKEVYRAGETKNFVSVHYGGSAFDLVTTLYKSASLSKEEIAKLRKLFEGGEEDP